MCGRVPAAEAVRMYREQGYSGIVITDHYSPLTFRGISYFCPQKYIDFYMSGYKAALAAAGNDFTVLFGMELRFYATANDYLVYGIDEAFLRKSGNLMAYYPKRFSRHAKENDLIFLQAHPFRPYLTRISPTLIDGCEVFNGKNAGTDANEKAERWAQGNHMAIRTSGSDFHKPKDLAKGGIITEEPIRSNADLKRVLRSGAFELIR